MLRRIYTAILLTLFSILKTYFALGCLFTAFTILILVSEYLFSKSLFKETIESGIESFELDPNNDYSKIYVIIILLVSALIFWPIMVYGLFKWNDEE